MGKSSSGRSRAESEVSSRSERRRTLDDADEPSTRTRSQADSPTSGSSHRRRSSRRDDRDRNEDENYTPTSKRYSTASQDPYTSSNVASSYATAPVEYQSGTRGSAADVAYDEVRRESRRDSTRSTGRNERSRALEDDEDYRRNENSRKDSEKSRRRDSKRQSSSSMQTGRESSRALNDHDASLPQNQFPGQAPDFFTAPYRPPGLAAEYYNDHGESIAQQPGVRPEAPSVIQNADQAHLYTPSAEAHPPPEPSSLGQLGAAASYFAMDAPSGGNVAQSTPSRPSQAGRMPSSGRPDSTKTTPVAPGRISTSGIGMGTIGAVAAGAGVGAAADYFAGANNYTSSSYSQQNVTSSSGYQGAAQQNTYTRPGYGSSSQPQRPAAASSSSYNTAQNNDYAQDMYNSPSGGPRPNGSKPHYGAAVAAAGLAGAAAAGYYAHNQHENAQNQQSGYGQGSNGSFVLGQNQSAFPGMQQQRIRRQRRGPINKLVNWFRDPDGVAQFEQYTEAIGVCKYCFDPNSSPADAPRRHHYHTHEYQSSGRQSSAARVRKSYGQSYSSSSDEGKRKRSSTAGKVVAGGLVGYGAAKVGEALYKQKNDFDDTYSVKSGQPISPAHNQFNNQMSAARTESFGPAVRDERNSQISRYTLAEDDRSQRRESQSSRITRRDEERYADGRRSSRRHESNISPTGMSRGAAMSATAAAAGAGLVGLEASNRRRSRSRSSSRDRTNNIRRKRSYYSKRISPRHSYVDLSTKNTGPLGFGSFFSSPSANEKKGKKSKGLFNLRNDSSSSSDADLAFGEGTVKRRTSRKTSNRRGSGDGLGGTAAILGLAATGAALAAESDRRRDKDKRKSRQSTTDNYPGAYSRDSTVKKINLQDHETTTDMGDEGVWEDASDDDRSSTDSIDTALAYGGRLSARNSRESLAEQGTSKWAWRWNKNKDKKVREHRQSDSYQRPHEQSTYDLVSAGMAGAGAGAIAGQLISHEPSPAQSTPLPPMQWIDPMPTTSPGLQDTRKISVINDGPSPHTIVSRSPAPLKQPQAFTGPSVAAMPQVLNKLETDAQLTDSPTEITPSSSDKRRVTEDSREKTRPRRNSSPPLINPSLSSRNSVSWKLTDEQIENERKAVEKEERRRRRREEKARRSSSEVNRPEVQQDIEVKAPVSKPRTESLDKRAAREAEIDKELQALYAEHERQMEEQKMLEEYRRAHGEVGGIGAAIVGAGVGAATTAMIIDNTKSAESDSDRKSRRKSGRSRDSMEKIDKVDRAERAPDPPSPPRQSSPPKETQQERIAKMAAQRVRSNASPVHDDYAAYFVPQEIAEHVKEHNAASESRREATPKIITIDPDSVLDPRERPFSPDKYQRYGTSSRHDLDYHPRGVPLLELIPATPPGSRPSSSLRERSPLRGVEPVTEDKDVGQPEKPVASQSTERRMSSGSKVNWGSNSTHVFEVETPEYERKDPVIDMEEAQKAQKSTNDDISFERPSMKETRQYYDTEREQIDRSEPTSEIPPGDTNKEPDQASVAMGDEFQPARSTKTKRDKKKRRSTADDNASSRSSASSVQSDSQKIPPVEEMTAEQREHLSLGKDFRDLPPSENVKNDDKSEDAKSVSIAGKDDNNLLGRKNSYQSPFAESVSDLGDIGNYRQRDLPKTSQEPAEPQLEFPPAERKSAEQDENQYTKGRIEDDLVISDEMPTEKPRSTRSERRRLERALSSGETVTPIIKTIEPDEESIPEEEGFNRHAEENREAPHQSMPGGFGVFDYLVDDNGAKMPMEENRKLEMEVASALSKRSAKSDSPTVKKSPTLANTSLKRDIPMENSATTTKPHRANTLDDIALGAPHTKSVTEYASDPEDWERQADLKQKRDKKSTSKSDVGQGTKAAIAAAAAGATIATAIAASEPSRDRTSRSASEPDFYAKNRNSSPSASAEPDFYTIPKEKRTKKSKRDSEILDDTDTKSVTSTSGAKDEDKKSKRRSKRDSEIFDDNDDDIRSAASLPTSKDEDKKSKRKSKRDSGVFDDDDDTRSVTSTSTEKRKSRDKEKEKKSAGLFASLFSSNKSDLSTSSKKSSKSSKSESRVDRDRDESDAREKRKKRKSKGDDNYDDSMSIASEPASRPGRDRGASLDQENDKPPAQQSRDTSIDNGFVSADEGESNDQPKHHDNDVESFLAMGPEMPQPMVTNMPMGTDGVSGLASEGQSLPNDNLTKSRQVEDLSTASTERDLPPLPVQDNEERESLSTFEDFTVPPNLTPAADRTRRLSAIRTDDYGSSPVVAHSPTAVPLRFGRRFPVTPGSEPRSVASPTPVSPLTTPRSRQARPKSTEFTSGKDFKPLYLLERHSTAKAPPVEEEENLPSLPSSRTSSAHPSMEDLRGQAQLEEQDYFSGEPSSPESSRPRGRQAVHADEEYLDSRSATPVPGERQRARETDAEIRERKEKLLKYAFHSPSELLQDPAFSQDVDYEHIDDPRDGSPLPSVVSTDHEQEFMSAESRVASPEQDRDVVNTTFDERQPRQRSPSRERSRNKSTSSIGLGIAAVAAAGATFAHEEPKPFVKDEVDQTAEHQDHISSQISSSALAENAKSGSDEAFLQQENDAVFQPMSAKKSKKDKKKKRNAVDLSNTIPADASDQAVISESAVQSMADTPEPVLSIAQDRSSSTSTINMLEPSNDVADVSKTLEPEDNWALPRQQSKKDKKKRKGKAVADELPALDTTAANDESTATKESEPSTAVPIFDSDDQPFSTGITARDAGPTTVVADAFGAEREPSSGKDDIETPADRIQAVTAVQDKDHNAEDDIDLVISRTRSESFVPTLAEVNAPENGLGAFEEAFERAISSRGLPTGITREDALDAFLPKRDNAPFVPKTGLTPVPEGTPTMTVTPPDEGQPENNETTGDRVLDVKPSKKSNRAERKGRKVAAAGSDVNIAGPKQSRDLSVEEGQNQTNTEVLTSRAQAGKNPYGDDFEIGNSDRGMSEELRLADADVNPFGNDYEIQPEEANAPQVPVSDVEVKIDDVDRVKNEIAAEAEANADTWAPTPKKGKKKRKNQTPVASSEDLMQSVVGDSATRSIQSSEAVEGSKQDIESAPGPMMSEAPLPIPESEEKGAEEPEEDLAWSSSTKKSKKKMKKDRAEPITEPDPTLEIAPVSQEQKSEDIVETHPDESPREMPASVENDWSQSSVKGGKKSKKDKKRKPTTDWTEDVLAPAAVVAGSALTGVALANVLGHEKGAEATEFNNTEDKSISDSVHDKLPTEKVESSESTNLIPEERLSDKVAEVDSPVNKDLVFDDNSKTRKDKKKKKSKSSTPVELESAVIPDEPAQHIENKTIAQDSITKSEAEAQASSMVSPTVEQLAIPPGSTEESSREIQAEPEQLASMVELSAAEDWSLPLSRKASKKDKKKKRQSSTLDLEDTPDDPLNEKGRDDATIMETAQDKSLPTPAMSSAAEAVFDQDGHAKKVTESVEQTESQQQAPVEELIEDEWALPTRTSSKKDKKKKVQQAATNEEKISPVNESREIEPSQDLFIDSSQGLQTSSTDRGVMNDLPDIVETASPEPAPESKRAITSDAATEAGLAKTSQNDESNEKAPTLGPPTGPSLFDRQVSFSDALNMSLVQTTAALAAAGSKVKKKKTVGTSPRWQAWSPSASMVDTEIPERNVADLANEISPDVKPVATTLLSDKEVENPLPTAESPEELILPQSLASKTNETYPTTQDETQPADEEDWALPATSKKAKKSKKSKKSGSTTPSTDLVTSDNVAAQDRDIASTDIASPEQEPGETDNNGMADKVLVSADDKESIDRSAELAEVPEFKQADNEEPEDAWAPTPKKSKKDKKKRKSGLSTPSKSAEPSHEPAIVPEAESVNMSAIQPSPEESIEPDAVDNVATPTETQEIANEVPAEIASNRELANKAQEDDQWAFTRKGSKKDKKKKKSGVSTPLEEYTSKSITQPGEEPSLNASQDSTIKYGAGVLQLHDNAEDQPKIVQEQQMSNETGPVPIEPALPSRQEEEEWAIPKKASKKDKKKNRQSSTFIPIEDNEEVFTDNVDDVPRSTQNEFTDETIADPVAAQPITSRDIDSTADALPLPVQQEPKDDDEWAMSKLSKKDKKKKRKSEVSTPAEEVSVGPSVVEAEQSNERSVALDDKNSSALRLERAEMPNLHAEQSATDAQQQQVSSLEQSFVDESQPKTAADEDWGLAGTSSKKDKKKNKKAKQILDLGQTTSEIPLEEVQQRSDPPKYETSPDRVPDSTLGEQTTMSRDRSVSELHGEPVHQSWLAGVDNVAKSFPSKQAEITQPTVPQEFATSSRPATTLEPSLEDLNPAIPAAQGDSLSSTISNTIDNEPVSTPAETDTNDTEFASAKKSKKDKKKGKRKSVGLDEDESNAEKIALGAAGASAVAIAATTLAENDNQSVLADAYAPVKDVDSTSASDRILENRDLDLHEQTAVSNVDKEDLAQFHSDPSADSQAIEDITTSQADLDNMELWEESEAPEVAGADNLDDTVSDFFDDKPKEKDEDTTWMKSNKKGKGKKGKKDSVSSSSPASASAEPLHQTQLPLPLIPNTTSENVARDNEFPHVDESNPASQYDTPISIPATPAETPFGESEPFSWTSALKKGKKDKKKRKSVAWSDADTSTPATPANENTEGFFTTSDALTEQRDNSGPAIVVEPEPSLEAVSTLDTSSNAHDAEPSQVETTSLAPVDRTQSSISADFEQAAELARPDLPTPASEKEEFSWAPTSSKKKMKKDKKKRESLADIVEPPTEEDAAADRSIQDITEPLQEVTSEVVEKDEARQAQDLVAEDDWGFSTKKSKKDKKKRVRESLATEEDEPVSQKAEPEQDAPTQILPEAVDITARDITSYSQFDNAPTEPDHTVKQSLVADMTEDFQDEPRYDVAKESSGEPHPQTRGLDDAMTSSQPTVDEGNTQAVPQSDHDMPMQDSQESMSRVVAEEDEWALPGKKSKKDKKKKRQSTTDNVSMTAGAIAAAVGATAGAAGTAAFLHGEKAEAADHQESAEYTKRLSTEQDPDVSNAILPSEDPVEDVWMFDTKKSKKDKKKKGQPKIEDESPIASERFNSDDKTADRALESEGYPKALHTFPELTDDQTSFTPAVDTAEDNGQASGSKKKSKKVKKISKGGFSDGESIEQLQQPDSMDYDYDRTNAVDVPEAQLLAHATGNSQTETPEADMAAESAQDADDTWFSGGNKRSKKDKKKNRRSNTDNEPPADVAMVSEDVDRIFVAPSATANTPTTVTAVSDKQESGPSMFREPVKSRDTERSAIQLDHQEVFTLADNSSSKHNYEEVDEAQKDLPTVDVGAFDQTLADNDEWATTSKPSKKKDKKSKKRQSTIEQDSSMAATSRDIAMDDAPVEESSPQHLGTDVRNIPAPASTEEIVEDIWAIPSKKSKKSKKKGKTNLTDNDDLDGTMQTTERDQGSMVNTSERSAEPAEGTKDYSHAPMFPSAKELHEHSVHQNWLVGAHTTATGFPTRPTPTADISRRELDSQKPLDRDVTQLQGTSAKILHEAPIHQDWLAGAHTVAADFPPQPAPVISESTRAIEDNKTQTEQDSGNTRQKTKKNKKGKKAIEVENESARTFETETVNDRTSAPEGVGSREDFVTHPVAEHEDSVMHSADPIADMSDTGSNVSESTRERRRRRRSPPLQLGDEPEDLPRDRALTPPPDHDDIMDTALGIAAGLGFGSSQAEHSQDVQARNLPSPGDDRGRPGWSFANLDHESKTTQRDFNRDSGIHSEPHDNHHGSAEAVRDSGYAPSPAGRDSWEGVTTIDEPADSTRRPTRPQSPTSSTEDIRTKRRSHVSVVEPSQGSETSRDLHATPVKRQPSPISPTSKERSSVLFQSSPAGSTPNKTPKTDKTTHLQEPESGLHRTPSVHGHQHRSREELRQEGSSSSARRRSSDLSSSLIHRAASSEVDRAAFSPSPRHSAERVVSPTKKSLQPIPEGSSPLGSLAAAAALGGAAAVGLQSAASHNSRDDPATRSRSLGKSKSRTNSQRNLRDGAASPFDPSHSEAGPSRASVHDSGTAHGAARDRDMAEQYDGYGSYPGSPMSPTRPPSVRKRQSMQQIRDLEAKVDQLANENRSLAEAKIIAERHLEEFNLQQSRGGPEAGEALKSANTQLQLRDQEIVKLRGEIASLVATHETLRSDHEKRYSTLQDEHTQARTQWQESTRELEGLRSQHDELSSGMEDIVRHEIDSALAQKNIELQRLRSELDAARAQIRELQAQILARGADEIVAVRDEDYFDNACQQLCQHVQQWVLRFSKFSDTRVCRGTNEVRDEKIVDRFDNAILDGSDVDLYLADRVKRRDIFMSVVMTMIWEYVFTRYLFGMDRDQRQKLKQLEKNLAEVGPPNAVHQWRALTLTLLSKREAFKQQCESDTEAVVLEIMKTLSKFLPPPQNLEQQVHESLRKVLRAAVDLSIEMRTQKAEYIMLPPLQPEYDTNGDLARKVFFNASLMNERSGETVSNDDVENSRAVVRIVLFPLVVKKGDDGGHGDEEIVVCPAQVLVARPDKGKRPKSRLASGGSADARSLRAASTHSLAMSGVDMTGPGGSNMI